MMFLANMRPPPNATHTMINVVPTPTKKARAVETICRSGLLEERPI
jgi:hypothetical protein